MNMRWNRIGGRRIKGKKGFTLVELITVVAIMATVSSVSIPLISGVIKTSNEVICQTNTNTIERTFLAYQIDHEQSTLQGALEGRYSDFPVDMTTNLCPSDGEYFVEENHIICRRHSLGNETVED